MRKNKIDSIRIEHIVDQSPDLSYLGEYSDQPSDGYIKHSEDGKTYKYFNPAQKEYAKKDYKRMEDYNDGLWHMIGIVAKADILVPSGNDSWISQTISSSGLWGIESDSSEEYLKEIGKEQLGDLKGYLKSLSVDLSKWEELIKNIEVK